MIYRHIILFRFKPFLTLQDIEAVFSAIGSLEHKIKGILGYSWGPNQSDYRMNAFDYCFVMDFDSKLSRDEYQVHTEHLRVVNEWVIPHVLEASVFDYMM